MRVLLADDERSIAVTLGDDLRRAGHAVRVASDGAIARRALDEQAFDVLITDVRMPGASGTELLADVRRRGLRTEVVLMTGYATLEAAVQAMREGAFDYVKKPFDNEEILRLLERMAGSSAVVAQNADLRTAGAKRGIDGLVGRSPAMQGVVARIQAVAVNDARVLITGASGTGKERVARALHEGSLRRSGPFVALACAAIPDALLEAEVFGHEMGAFTDAKERKAGRFERAQGGTLFLDDIDDMPFSTQVKLLRVLQEGEIEPLGATQPLRVDVRVIAATKVDLAAAVDAGRFREDLYYRLNVVPIALPPLCERGGDVTLLVQHFLSRLTNGRTFVVPPETLQALEQHDWPGNVRELENAVERAVALAGPDGVLHIELMVSAGRARRSDSASKPPRRPATDRLDATLAVAEREHIERVLDAVRGARGEAARILGISRKHLWSKITEHGLDR